MKHGKMVISIGPVDPEVTKKQKYIPEGCTMDGNLVLRLVNEGQDPCADCNEDRKVCGGRPRVKIVK